MLLYIRRKCSASCVACTTIAWSITIRLYSGVAAGVHCDGKSGPKMGISAPAMCWQKVAQTALAHWYGIQ